MHISRLKSFVPDPLLRLRRAAMAKARHLSAKIEIPTVPHFDDEGVTYFLDRLARASCYLEYGSGGSTVCVAKRGIPFTSVDSDRRFLSAVEAKAREDSDLAVGRFIAVDIGLITEWGYPLFENPTPKHVEKWKRYPMAPWPMNPLPDLVLVDGRFRVACALAALRNLYDKIDFEILIDDYRDRDCYRPIEQFAALHAMRGRMAVLKQKSVSIAELDLALTSFVADFR